MYMSVLFTSQFHDKNRPKAYLELKDSEGVFGKLLVTVFTDLVPIAASEFLAHIVGHYGPSYEGCHWERIAPGFVAQASSPNPMLPYELSVMTTSSGEECDKHIDIEKINPLSFDRRGRVGLMFHYETRKLTPQFFIALGDAIYLDGTFFVVGQIDMSDENSVDTLDRLEEAGLTQEMILNAQEEDEDIPFAELVGECRRDIVISKTGLCDTSPPIPLGYLKQPNSTGSESKKDETAVAVAGDAKQDTIHHESTSTSSSSFSALPSTSDETLNSPSKPDSAVCSAIVTDD